MTAARREPAAPPPLSLYVHFPWCVRKCPYCDFNSHAQAADGSEASSLTRRYLEALRADLRAALPTVWGRTVISIFIGGGTPSLMQPDELDRLLSDLRALLPLAADCEVTLEANPGTVEAGRFRDFRGAGVNRLSLGIQSFDDDMLARLGRIHDGAQSRRAAELAQREFERFNLDLMWALPGQSPERCAADLDCALRFEPPHLSLYQLALEPNTVFAKFPPVLPGEDEVERMQALLEQRAGAAGFEHYEISAFARPGQRCRHNLNYWTFGDYLGIGAGAHSKLTLRGAIVRQERFQSPESYLDNAGRGAFASREWTVGAELLPFEFMLNALRLRAGVPAALFGERTGLSTQALTAAMQRAQARGLVVEDPTRICATALGLRFLNDLQAIFLPPDAPKKSAKAP
jgi:putative oxygen-independent coproporphyrinogen III oxidase